MAVKKTGTRRTKRVGAKTAKRGGWKRGVKAKTATTKRRTKAKKTGLKSRKIRGRRKKDDTTL